MRAHELWQDVEKRAPRALRVSAELIKALVDEPSKHLVPKVDPATGAHIGIDASTPSNPSPLTVEMGDWLVHHPNGYIERVDGHTFAEAYTLCD